ncbi:hypothetical protein PHMEG_00031144 [Phytophthora megakarya]|uniref:Uncharacterized protein n=1 Tax=Phytophthora megakarya TaxID=4795 RepID=A0A225V001_9STRA|nr:hypothetical protein PHMEG_00031144 [Phytophthora megakarya]
MADLQVAHDQLAELRGLAESDLNEADDQPEIEGPEDQEHQDQHEIEDPEEQELEDKPEFPSGGGDSPGNHDSPPPDHGPTPPPPGHSPATPPPSPPRSPGGSSGGGSPGGGSPIQVYLPTEASIPHYSALKRFTAAEIHPWDPATVGIILIIVMIKATLTKRMQIPPNFLFPFRNPLIRAPIPVTGYRSELITGANVLALMATETPLWLIAVSYAALEEDHMIAYWESTHYFEITSAMTDADSDHFTYHQDQPDIDFLLDPYFLHLPTKQDRVRWYPGSVSRAANLTQPTANLPEPTDLITVLFECDQEDPWRNHYRDPGSAHSSLSIPRLVNKFNHPAAP